MTVIYDVYVDCDPDELTKIAYAVMLKWIAFALGEESIHGYRIEHPTGKYASSIRVEGRSPTQVAVVADERLAPEALWLEVGHSPIDLKRTSLAGRTVPLHRGAAGTYYGATSQGYGSPILNSTLGGRTKNVWAVPRAQGLSGFRRVPTAATARSPNAWVIPAMPAWSPANYLAQMIRRGDFSS